MSDDFLPLEKILTISARDYCDGVGRKLSDYKFEGVYITSFSEKEGEEPTSYEGMPEGTEVVVAFMPIDIYETDRGYGTALIPKRRRK